MNSINLIGNLVEDPRTGKTTGGTSYTLARIAVNRRIKTEKGPSADYIPVIAWGLTAEFIAKYFVKGKAIAISGQLQSRDYTDKDGNKRTAIEVLCENAEFVGPKEQSKADQDQSFVWEPWL